MRCPWLTGAKQTAATPGGRDTAATPDSFAFTAVPRSVMNRTAVDAACGTVSATGGGCGGSPLVRLRKPSANPRGERFRTPNKDVAEDGELRLAEPLPPSLLAARAAVAADFGLAENWLNTGPTDLLKSGLPESLISRVVTRSYGTGLVVHFAGRLDQIHFKLFAMVDQGGGRHETDLRALSPTPGELAAAARWSITQDPSPGYRSVLVDALRVLGVNDADLGD
jgi:hypothetical protein